MKTILVLMLMFMAGCSGLDDCYYTSTEKIEFNTIKSREVGGKIIEVSIGTLVIFPGTRLRVEEVIEDTIPAVEESKVLALKGEL